MGKILNALKAGVGAAIKTGGPKRYQVKGRALKCPACGNDRFAKGEAQLHTGGMTFVGLEWTQRASATLACTECSRLEWFLEEPDEST